MPSVARFIRATPMIVASSLAISTTHGFAEPREGHDFVIDTARDSARSGLTGQCIRTGVPDAGAPVEACNPKPAKAPVPPAQPAATPPAPAPEPPAVSAAPVPPPVEEKPLPAPVVEKPAARPAQPSVAHVTLNAETDFDFDQWTLRPSGKAKLDQFVQELKGVQYSMVRAVGHTDRIGTAQFNHWLSVRRAQEVKDYLAGNQVDRRRIVATGVGAAQPVTKPGQCDKLDRPALIKCLQPDRRVEVDAQATKIAGQ